MLDVVDASGRECLAIGVARKPTAIDVIDALSDLFILRGVPQHLRSGQGPGFIAEAVRNPIAAVAARTAYNAPGSPRENGFVERSRPGSGTNDPMARPSTRSAKHRSS